MFLTTCHLRRLIVCVWDIKATHLQTPTTVVHATWGHLYCTVTLFYCLKEQTALNRLVMTFVFYYGYYSCIKTINGKIMYKHRQQNCHRKHSKVSCAVTLVRRRLRREIPKSMRCLSVSCCIGDLTVEVINQIWQVVTHLNAGSGAVCQPTSKSVNQSIMRAVNRCMKNWTSPCACY